MKLPRPFPGLVIRYSFLWRRDVEAGREEGSKDRPCAVILAVPTTGERIRVIVLPVTHASPAKLAATIEIPPRVKAHLGLDEQQSWIVLEEANEFIWPGFDLRPVPGAEPTRSDYGVLPPRFFAQVRDAFLTVARERPLKPVGRD